MVFYSWLPVFVLYGACALINFLTISPKVSIISDPEDFFYISDQSKSARSEFPRRNLCKYLVSNSMMSFIGLQENDASYVSI